MKVKTLIKRLKELDGDLDVYVSVLGNEGAQEVMNVLVEHSLADIGLEEDMPELWVEIYGGKR